MKCQYNGRFVPVGYKIDETKRYQLDALVAPLVREAFMMYVNVNPIKDIAEFLNSHAPAAMKADVKYILSTKLYCGGAMVGYITITRVPMQKNISAA